MEKNPSNSSEFRISSKTLRFDEIFPMEKTRQIVTNFIIFSRKLRFDEISFTRNLSVCLSVRIFGKSPMSETVWVWPKIDATQICLNFYEPVLLFTKITPTVTYSIFKSSSSDFLTPRLLGSKSKPGENKQHLFDLICTSHSY